MRKTSIFMLLSLALVANAQDDTDQTVATGSDIYARDTYRTETLVCPFKGRIDYDPGEIECGLLQVPENRENLDSRFIELHFVKLNSTWDEEEDKEKEEEDDD